MPTYCEGLANDRAHIHDPFEPKPTLLGFVPISLYALRRVSSEMPCPSRAYFNSSFAGAGPLLSISIRNCFAALNLSPSSLPSPSTFARIERDEPSNGSPHITPLATPLER